MGGATQDVKSVARPRAISIHAPRGGSDRRAPKPRNKKVISIHAPRGGSDWMLALHTRRRCHFNPRSPWGERLSGYWFWRQLEFISIHAPRGGSDRSNLRFVCWYQYFNPRSPWGERLALGLTVCCLSIFQSTLPVGGATLTWTHWKAFMGISIHAPRGGSDCWCSCQFPAWFYFNPRSPWGERQACFRGCPRSH